MSYKKIIPILTTTESFIEQIMGIVTEKDWTLPEILTMTLTNTVRISGNFIFISVQEKVPFIKERNFFDFQTLYNVTMHPMVMGVYKRAEI